MTKEIIEELNYIINNIDFERDPVKESIIENTYTINGYEISKEAYIFIINLIKKELRNKKLLKLY